MYWLEDVVNLGSWCGNISLIHKMWWPYSNSICLQISMCTQTKDIHYPFPSKPFFQDNASGICSLESMRADTNLLSPQHSCLDCLSKPNPMGKGTQRYNPSHLRPLFTTLTNWHTWNVSILSKIPSSGIPQLNSVSNMRDHKTDLTDVMTIQALIRQRAERVLRPFQG